MGKLGNYMKGKQMEKQATKADIDPHISFILKPKGEVGINFSNNWNPLALIGFMDDIAVNMTAHKNSVRQAYIQYAKQQQTAKTTKGTKPDPKTQDPPKQEG